MLRLLPESAALTDLLAHWQALQEALSIGTTGAVGEVDATAATGANGGDA